jgi:hypothetical protein
MRGLVAEATIVNCCWGFRGPSFPIDILVSPCPLDGQPTAKTLRADVVHGESQRARFSELLVVLPTNVLVAGLHDSRLATQSPCAISAPVLAGCVGAGA